MLLEFDVLVRNQEISKQETVRNELTCFKNECDENEKARASISNNRNNEKTMFVNRTDPSILFFTSFKSFYRNIESRLGKNIILKIAKYLTLNDTIDTSTISILPLLRQQETTVETCDPDNLFINTILLKFKPKRIVSLRITPIWYCTERDPSRLNSDSDIITVSLLNFPDRRVIVVYQNCFSRVTCLWYDNEVNFTLFYDLLG
ncbi:unnamed protein product [Rotaria socialis]|uniref:Uncharacterized protein n=1 Tax=Rotaria socialis TaxID=392032 RepID=A0A818C2L1_9BILA|nr:unnamed protein product [Rotaria socialis]